MALNRSVTITIPESICARIEQLEKQPIENVLQDLITSYLQDKRRTGIETVEIGIAWPPDWYQQMLRRWGKFGVATNVRALVYDYLNDEPKWPLSPPLSLRDRTVTKSTRKVVAQNKRASYVANITLAKDWHDRMLERWGHGRVTTFMKAIVYREIVTWNCWRGTDGPSMPLRLRQALDEI